MDDFHNPIANYIGYERAWLDTLRLQAGDSPELSLARYAIATCGPCSSSALVLTEWSTLFETYMRNRLIMGALRYGRLGQPGKPQYDRVCSIRIRLEKYAATGVQEHLVDIANECLVEFTEPSNPLAHWATADDGYHTEIKP